MFNVFTPQGNFQIFKLFCCPILAGTKLVYFFETRKFLEKNLKFDKFSCQKTRKYAEKHIFLRNYLVVLKKSSTFASCFSWY